MSKLQDLQDAKVVLAEQVTAIAAQLLDADRKITELIESQTVTMGDSLVLALTDGMVDNQLWIRMSVKGVQVHAFPAAQLDDLVAGATRLAAFVKESQSPTVSPAESPAIVD